MSLADPSRVFRPRPKFTANVPGVRRGVRPAFTVGVTILALAAAAGCYSTQGLPAPGLAALQRSEQDREIILAAGERSRVRIRPGSLLRFHRADGASTAWAKASDVRLTPGWVVIGWGPAAPQVLPWERVAGVEINDLDVGRTIVGAVAGTSLVLVAAMTEGIIVGALKAVRVDVGEIGLTRAVVAGVVAQAGRHLDDDSSPPLTETPEAGPPVAEVLAARPLFSTEARRRDLVRASLGVDSGVEMGAPLLRSQVGVFGSLRILNMLEVGAGVTMVDADTATFDGTPTLEAPLVERVRVTGRGRVGLHLDLDAGRRFALVLAQEVGVSSGGWLDARTVWGMRFRLRDNWQLGVLPMNPRVTWTRKDVLSRTAYATSIELVWLF